MEGMMRNLKDESGQVLVLTVLCMTVLFGFLALAIDVGLLFRAKRNLQIAADAAATAAALDYYYDNDVSLAQAVGTQAAADNGVTVSTGGPTVPFHTGANITTPYHQGPGYFEAILTQPNPTVFGGYLGIGSVVIGARAVAGTPGSSAPCVDATQPNGNLGAGGGNNSGVGKGTSTMWLQGSFTVNAANCPVLDQGINSDALDFNGGGGTLTAGSVSVVGGVSGQLSDSTPAAVTGVAPSTVPFQSLPFPTPSGCVSGGSITGSIGSAGGTTCYSGDSSGNLTVTNATLNGTVVFTGAGTVTFGGSVATGGGGGTIDIVNGGMTENAGTVFTLNAPTTGTYNGIVLMAPATNFSVMTFEFGHSVGTLSGGIAGIIYMPSATLFLHDSGGGTNALILNTDLIVGQLDDVTGSITINSYSGNHPNSPLKSVSLVE
jgi:hypothetical protein